MGTLIIVVILVAIVLLALRSSAAHLKGEGGCCGGGGLKGGKKRLKNKAIARKTMKIEGMRCDNCKNRVERALNEIDGASARVNLKKGTAVVSMDREIADDALRSAVEKENYAVTEIVSGEV